LFPHSPSITTAAPDPVLINLGGPRKVLAKITLADGEYRVDVRMLAVQAFDKATNDKVNRDKARLLALQALIRHLSGKNEAEATLSGARIVSTGQDKQFFTLTLALPKDKFSLVEPSNPAVEPAGNIPGHGGERLKWKSELFTKKDDLLRTIDFLAMQFLNDIALAEKAEKEFDDRIAETEERAAIAFKALRNEVASEILLLSIEKEELVDKAKDAERQVTARLMQAVEQEEKKQHKHEGTPR
jgi:hypothetical protein